MPCSDATNPAALERFIRDHLQRTVERVVRLVDMHVDVRIVFFRDIKANAHMLSAVVR
ncbi:hypothetical protein SDC9_210552 [bioreactor metagenome]|uniref:Uncharacterized protein n=1 Tax=bioreactor metagenome TaxID=1076179 RepID=A0A645JJC4_9ZZZZ